MSVRLNGTGYLKLDQRLVSALPFTICGWVTQNSDIDSSYVSQAQTSPPAFTRNSVEVFHAEASGWVAARQLVTDNQSYVTSTLASPNATFGFAVAVFTATGITVYWRDNTPHTTATVFAQSLTAQNNFTIGAVSSSTGGFAAMMNGSIAEVSVYNRELTAAEILSRINDTVKGEDISGVIAHFPLRNAADLTSTNGTYTLTPVGGVSDTGAAAHPVTRVAAPSATLAWTEANDVSAVVGNVVITSIAGVLSWTEANDVSSVSAVVRPTAQVAWTEVNDVSSITGTGSSGITTGAFKNNTGTVLASLTALTVTVLSLPSLSFVKTFTNQTTNSSGIMNITDALLVPGTQYAVVTTNASGTLGVEKYTAA